MDFEVILFFLPSGQPQASGLTSGKGVSVRLGCWTANSSFLAVSSGAVQQSSDTRRPAALQHRRPQRAPLILSLLFARTPAAVTD